MELKLNNLLNYNLWLTTSPAQTIYLSHPFTYLHLFHLFLYVKISLPHPFKVKPLPLDKTFIFSWLNLYLLTNLFYSLFKSLFQQNLCILLV
jgi:hypothetical protein